MKIIIEMIFFVFAAGILVSGIGMLLLHFTLWIYHVLKQLFVAIVYQEE